MKTATQTGPAKETQQETKLVVARLGGSRVDWIMANSHVTKAIIELVIMRGFTILESEHV